MIEHERLTLWLPDGAALLRLLRDDLARGALFVPTDAPPDLATPVTIRVQIGSHPRALELEGTVVHTARAGDSGSTGPGAGLLIHGAARAVLAASQLLPDLEPQNAPPGPDFPAGERSSAERSAAVSRSREPSPVPQIAGPTPRKPSPVPGLPLREVITDHAAAGMRDESGEERLKRLLRPQQDLISEGADHYRVLGLKRNADADEIRSAFYDRAKKFHPDAHFRQIPAELVLALERVYQRVSEAYQVLSIPQKRIAYDRKLTEAAPRATERRDAGAEQRTPTAVRGPVGSPPPRSNSPGDVPRDQPRDTAGQLSFLLDKAWAAQMSGDLLAAKSSVQLALALDPVSQEARNLLRLVEEGLAMSLGSERSPTPAPSSPGRRSSPAPGAADERPGQDRGRFGARATIGDKDLSQWLARQDKPVRKEPRREQPEEGEGVLGRLGKAFRKTWTEDGADDRSPGKKK